MDFLNTTRARLLAGALVALVSTGAAFVSTRQADATTPRATPWNTSAAWRQYCGHLGRAPSGSVSTSIPPAVQRSLDDLDNRNAEDATLRQALGACNDARVRDRQHNIHAYLCVGRANLMDTVPDHNARDAYCAYHSAALLARQARNTGLQSQAHIGRANALRAFGSSDEVTAAYNDAIRANPNASDARVALARYYVGRGREWWDDARALLIDRQGAPVVRSAEAAVAIIELARASTEPNSAEYLALVRVAEAAIAGMPSGNVGVNSALGAAYFESDRPRARGYLRAATEGAVPANETEQALQLIAFYYRSIIEAEEGNYDRAREYADQAGGTAEARRQQCLVRLMMGREAIYRLTTERRAGRDQVVAISPSDDGQRACTSNPAPDGPLLEGMFWLRYAQWQAHYFNPQLNRANDEAWSRYVSYADTAFARGKPRYNDDNRTPLGWPGAEAIAPRLDGSFIRLRDAYGFADDLADWFGRRIPCDPNFGMNLNSEEAQIEPLFVHYRVVRPLSRRPYRCGPPEIN